jgi:ribosomal protein S18 acetylase RimI-like enzyme
VHGEGDIRGEFLKTKMIIKSYSPENEKDVIALWNRCNLTRPVNDPKKDIERKLKVNPELFLVGLIDNKVIASVIGGYDGHRGWVYYLGVDPAHRRKGLGRQMMAAIEKRIRAMGCPKINLQVRTDNLGAVKFYEKIGYKMDETVQLGKRLIPD